MSPPKGGKDAQEEKEKKPGILRRLATRSRLDSNASVASDASVGSTEGSDPKKGLLSRMRSRGRLDSRTSVGSVDRASTGSVTQGYQTILEQPLQEQLNNFMHVLIAKEANGDPDSVRGQEIQSVFANASYLLTQVDTRVLLKHKDVGTHARDAFLEFLDTRHLEIPDSDDQGPIELKQLLGSEGVKLYEAALIEESNSHAMRIATYLASIRETPGPKWQRMLKLLIGGPSASGKTFSTELLLKLIQHFDIVDLFSDLATSPDTAGGSPEEDVEDAYDDDADTDIELMAESPDETPQATQTGETLHLGSPAKSSPEHPSQESNNILVFDGATERNISLMKQVVLKIAEKKGYSTVLGMAASPDGACKQKSMQKKAWKAKKDSSLSTATPTTFVTFTGAKDKLGIGPMSQAAKRSDSQLIFAYTENSENPADFKAATAHGGLSRSRSKANLNVIKQPTDEPTELDPTTPATFDPKQPEKNHDLGVDGTNRARAAYIAAMKKAGKNAIVIAVINDLVPLKIENDRLVPCSTKDAQKGLGVCSISRRVYEEHKSNLQAQGDVSNQIDFLKAQKAVVEVSVTITPPKGRATVKTYWSNEINAASLQAIQEAAQGSSSQATAFQEESSQGSSSQAKPETAPNVEQNRPAPFAPGQTSQSSRPKTPPPPRPDGLSSRRSTSTSSTGSDAKPPDSPPPSSPSKRGGLKS